MLVPSTRANGLAALGHRSGLASGTARPWVSWSLTKPGSHNGPSNTTITGIVIR